MVVIAYAAGATKPRLRFISGLLFWGFVPTLLLACIAGVVAEFMRGPLYMCARSHFAAYMILPNILRYK